MSDEYPVAYQCPGESYVISRAVHLGRLATYYPKCRDCVHRAETGTLSPRRVRRLAEIGRRAPRPGLVYGDCIAGALYTEVTRRVVRRLAAALAAFLGEHGRTDAPVVLGDDGRGPSAALAAAACEGLRWSGCDVVELGPVSAPMLNMALRRANAGGAIFVGNPLGSVGTCGLKFSSSDGRLAVGAGLERLVQLSELPLRRPGRRYGALSRLAIDEKYLSGLQPYFHALRPLRLVIDCRCGPVWRRLTALISATACELLPLSSRDTPCAVTGDGTRSVPAPNSPSPGTPGEGRGEGLAATAQPTLSTAAPPLRNALPKGEGIKPSLSPGTPGEGRGEGTSAAARPSVRTAAPPHPNPLAKGEGTKPPSPGTPGEGRGEGLLARRILVEHAHAGLWIDGDGEVLSLLDQTGRPIPPEQFAAAISPLAADSPPSDALHSFALLLTLLSQSDRPVSEVLASQVHAPKHLGGRDL
ncbi:MAG: hypothetical protein HY000_39945 [Planctomycetes bacterium]|nr:hypothetical protein [Planctomycetota bacterium]